MKAENLFRNHFLLLLCDGFVLLDFIRWHFKLSAKTFKRHSNTHTKLSLKGEFQLWSHDLFRSMTEHDRQDQSFSAVIQYLIWKFKMHLVVSIQNLLPPFSLQKRFQFFIVSSGVDKHGMALCGKGKDSPLSLKLALSASSSPAVVLRQSSGAFHRCLALVCCFSFFPRSNLSRRISLIVYTAQAGPRVLLGVIDLY